MLVPANMKVTSRRIPRIGVSIWSIESGTEGPRVAITANIHGDELSGLAVVHRLQKLLTECLFRGVVELYPSLNPEGLANCNRLYPISGHDLNRYFPGEGNHKASKHCAAIWNQLCHFEPDLLLDLHTDSGDALPYVIMDRVLSRDSALEHRLCQLADVTGLEALWEYAQPDYSRYSLHKSLTGAVVNQLGIPALTLEVGPRRYIHQPSVIRMRDSVLRVLSYLGCVDVTAIPSFGSQDHQKSLSAGDWRRASGPLCHSDGYWNPRIPVGTRVIEGAIIGDVIDSAGAVCQTITAPRGGLVLAYPAKSRLSSGQSCLTMAVPEV